MFKFLSGRVRKKIRLVWFVFKWFLIGKYHCNLPKWTLAIWWLAHKILWFFIAFSVAIAFQILKIIFIGE